MTEPPSGTEPTAEEPNRPPAEARDDPGWLHAAYQAIPQAGEGTRWYDLPYRTTHSVLRSGLGRRLPRLLRNRLYALLNFLHPFNEHDRNLVWSVEDPMHNVTVNPGERVDLTDIWLVEFFPPSEFRRLERALRRRGWDRDRARYGLGRRNSDALAQARTTRGWMWWRVGAIVRPGSGQGYPDAQVRKLPPEISDIDVQGATVGPSLTVVVAHVRLSATGRDLLNATWHGPHQPELVRHGLHFRATDRQWTAFRNTQQCRRSLHTVARTWMNDEMPGLFASSHDDQPLVDLLLFRDLDPLTAVRRSPADREALRALGISDGPYRITAPELPGLLLEPPDAQMHPDLPGTATWTLWGRAAAAADGHPDKGMGNDPMISVGLSLDHGMRDLAVRLGLLELLRLRTEQNAEARDTAREQHRRFRLRRSRHLRDSFLRSSLDTTSLVRDIKRYADNKRGREVTLSRTLEPWLTAPADGPAPPPGDLDAELAAALSSEADDLAAFDADYRAIMSTVATLGMSATALLTQRIAILIALSSLTIAVVALSSR